MENKLKICRMLAAVLKETRAGAEMENIDYWIDTDFNREYAVIIFRDGNIKTVDITADSGIAVIKDITDKL